MRADNELRRQVARLLRRRPGWRLEAMSTPGAPAVWRFGTEPQIEVSVSVDAGSIVVQLGRDGTPVLFGSVDALVTWLKSNRAASLTDRKDRTFDKLRAGTFFKWE